MVLADDQQLVKDLASQRAYDPLADSVRSGRLWRAGENPDAIRQEHGVEGIGELARSIPDQELDQSRALAEVHQEAAGCLCRPRAVRIRGDAGQVNPAGAVLDDDQRVDAPEQHGVNVDEVGREDAAPATSAPARTSSTCAAPLSLTTCTSSHASTPPTMITSWQPDSYLTGALVVLGRNSAGDSARPSTGAVTHAVLHHAHAPVAIIPE
jgi:hypothetical protein